MYDITNGLVLYNNEPSQRNEVCIVCGGKGYEICKMCGILCRQHGPIHRHEKGSNDHITHPIGHDAMKIVKQIIKTCKCSCGCKLTENEVFFDEKDRCILCDKGNRSDYPDELGRQLKEKERLENL